MNTEGELNLLISVCVRRFKKKKGREDLKKGER